MGHALLNVWKQLHSYSNTLSKIIPLLFALAGKLGTSVTAAANVKVIWFVPDLGG